MTWEPSPQEIDAANQVACSGRAVLDVVAPMVAARVLREAAQAAERDLWNDAFFVTNQKDQAIRTAHWLLRRADEIEREAR
jgi:hypothetical protein